MSLRIPKLRRGSFFPSLPEPRRRVDQALFAVVMEAYVPGASTRKVDDLVRTLGAEIGVSKSEVSRIWADLDADVAAFSADFYLIAQRALLMSVGFSDRVMRSRHFNAACSIGKCPRARIARR